MDDTRRNAARMLGDRHVAGDAAVVLLQLLEALRELDYRFVTPTPASHARVLARSGRTTAHSLRDVLGWSKAFRPDLLPPELLSLLDLAGALEPAGDGLLRSRLRVSSLDDMLYLHSAYPTVDQDAVFFGPDSYRFAALIEAELDRLPMRGSHIVDIGTGAGIGAITAARRTGIEAATGTDVNPQALKLAAINARAAGVALHTVQGDDLAGVGRPIDLALANPPYIIDDDKRHYRDGGDMLGCAVALKMARDAVPRLASGGRLILYTGSAIVEGRDALAAALAELAKESDASLSYRELDPDVFGEELARDAYREVERIALIAAVITLPA